MRVKNISGMILQINAAGAKPVILGKGEEYDFGSPQEYRIYEKPVVLLIRSNKLQGIEEETPKLPEKKKRGRKPKSEKEKMEQVVEETESIPDEPILTSEEAS